MRESVIENYLKLRVKTEGGLTRKWVSPGRVGVPDQLVIFPGGRGMFVETKAPNGVLKPWQKREHMKLRAMGCDVRVIYTKEQVNAFILEMTT